MLLFTSLAQFSFNDPKVDRLTIEIVCLEKVPIIKVHLNGKTSYFVLDSGSDISIFNSKDAKRYSFIVKNTASRDVKGFSGDRQGIYGVSEVKLTLGDQVLKTSFFASNLDHLVQHLEKSTSIKVSGIIGLDLMKKYNFEIDYQNKSLRFDLK